MHLLMRGEADPTEAAGLLMGLRARGETLDELVGFTRVMRQYAVHVDLDDPDAIDLCGTGGDSTGTVNISTGAALVCAGAGVTVAKHGNRSVSSKCGSADVLEALGVKVELGKAGVEHCLREVGIAFLFAPYFHPAMRFVMPVRRGLGVRTFFNILGPLCNPAGVRRQLVGAFSPTTAQTMASILAHLDARHIVAVHAADGMDEISLSAETDVFEYRAEMDDTVSGGARPHPPQATRIRPEEDWNILDPDTGEPYTFFPDMVTSGASVGVPGTPATWARATGSGSSRPAPAPGSTGARSTGTSGT